MFLINGRTADGAYRIATRAIRPVVPLILRYRLRRGKEEPDRLGERYGIASRSRPAGPLIWVHAASVGETNAVLPLIGRLIAAGEHILLTTGTVTSAQIAEKAVTEFPDAFLIHQFAPMDIPTFVDRFIDYWQPHLAIFAESELWPVMTAALTRRGKPLALVNARMSDRSFRRWRKAPAIARTLMDRIGICLAQSEEDARRYRELGAGTVVCTGNLKLDTPPLSVDESALGQLKAMIGTRPVLFAASTHTGEDETIISAHTAITASMDAGSADLLTIIAPRHPDRGAQIAGLVIARGLEVASRSLGELPDNATAVYIADTIGEMGLWYRLATLTFLGGSLVPHGGQNPVEAAKLGAPVLHGPHVDNFKVIYQEMDEEGAAVSAEDPDAMISAIARLLASADARANLAKAAKSWSARSTGALDRTLAALGDWRADQHNG